MAEHLAGGPMWIWNILSPSLNICHGLIFYINFNYLFYLKIKVIKKLNIHFIFYNFILNKINN
jgi:hypothetical protein